VLPAVMPSLTVNDNIKFFYTDNGAPSPGSYKTLILIHGHTFHSGTCLITSAIDMHADVLTRHLL
jgi:hypothetical protein